MNKKIQISRETKIVLLKAIKNGYFETSDLENILTVINSGLSKEDIKELQKRAGMEEIIEVTFDF